MTTSYNILISDAVRYILQTIGRLVIVAWVLSTIYMCGTGGTEWFYRIALSGDFFSWQTLWVLPLVGVTATVVVQQGFLTRLIQFIAPTFWSSGKSNVT